MANINKSIQKIEKVCGKIVRTSSVYETAPWGFLDQGSFLNQVIVLKTQIPSVQLMQQLLVIEQEIGRIRAFKLGPRIIDLDILLIDHEIINNSILTVPHPELHKRRFALIPLAEVAEEIYHPIFDKSIGQLMSECTDKGHVQKFYAQ